MLMESVYVESCLSEFYCILLFYNIANIMIIEEK